MKIWIDLTNSPHINFFKPFINIWEKEGYEIVITARDLGNTIDLIKQNGWKYTEVGGHAGKNLVKKLLYFPKRVFLLKSFLKNVKPDIGISHSSFYSPVVGKISGFPTIYLNDNEHAKGNYIAFMFATLNLVPECLKEHSVKMKWDKKFKMDYYPGIKEGIYLSRFEIEPKNHATKHIFIRLEPWNAQYYKGKNEFMDELILQLKEEYIVTILPRGGVQAQHYLTSRFAGINVTQKPISLKEITEKCDLFIGAGGSMTREMAFLGIPTLSVYQDELLEVDKYLINNQQMYHSISPTIQEIESILNTKSTLTDKKLFQMGVQAFEIINNKVKEYAKN